MATSSRTFYTALIAQTAGTYDLDADLVEALVICESAGRADAFRFEPQYAHRYRIATKYPQWPVRAVASSYGLMQIMCPTAFGLGFAGEPEELFQPAMNLDWGCRYLRACFDWANTYGPPQAATEADILRGALCGYNGGRNSNTSPLNPRPSNIAYAQRVLTTARGLVSGQPLA
jgi:soluble lytic murein transglycosylase-like protein